MFGARNLRPDVCPELFQAYRSCSLNEPFRAKISDHNHFFQCCHRHSLSARLFENLQRLGTDDPVLFQHAKQEYSDQFFQYAGFRDFLEKLHTRLQAADLKVTLLKGASLWLTCYSDPMLRHVSDIDILIRKAELPQLTAELSALGYTGDQQLKLFRDGSGRIIDVHSGSLGVAEESSGLDSTSVIASARPAPSYPHFLTPDPALETYYLAFHAMKHSFLRLTWLDDIYLSYSRHKSLKTYAPHQQKTVDWALYLRQTLLQDKPEAGSHLNLFEKFLARRMLQVNQHPLGQFMLAVYQPDWPSRIRCLMHATRGRGGAFESKKTRLIRLLRELFKIWT